MENQVLKNFKLKVSYRQTIYWGRIHTLEKQQKQQTIQRTVLLKLVKLN